MANTILVIGGDKAALKAAVKARIQNPGCEVNVFMAGASFPYRDFGIPDFINMGIKDFQAFRQRIREYYKSEFNISISTDCDVKSILPAEKKIVVWDYKQKAEVYYEYGTLILATGSMPVYPSIEGTGLENVFFRDRADQVPKILECVDSEEVRQAVVIGGNLSGVQTAQVLWERNILVTLLEEDDHILPEFDMEIGAMACKRLMEKGIEVLTGQKILTLIGNVDGQVVEVHTPEHILACQIVLWITERKPDTELAEAAGLPLEDEAVAINDEMETGIPGIYAIGDCAGEKGLCNAVLSLGAGRIFDFHAAKTGFSTQMAMEAGYDPESVLVTAYDEPMYSHATQEMMAVLVADRVTRRLLGAQFLGETPVEKYTDFISALIVKDGTVDDLARVDRCTNSMEFMLLLSNAMLDKLDNLYEMISPVSLYNIAEDQDLVILDVRSEAEVTMSKIPSAVNIPLETLEVRKEELEREKTIVIVAKGYTQGRQAYEILFKNGFEQVSILEGGIAGYPYELE